MSHMENLNHLKIPLQVIQNCTEDFDERNFIGKGGYGKVYKGILSWADHKNQLVAVKRLDVTYGQGNKEFYTEITLLSQYQHENIVRIVGFCDDDKEMILVYEYASHGSLDKYLRDVVMLGMLPWSIRLNICIGVASALDYLHNHMAEKHRIIHRDIKSANILLDENWNAKLSDFGLSRIGLANQQNSAVITGVAGTYGYCDPQYQKTGILTKESDVYSLGVVLFEVLCGRLVCVNNYEDERRFLPHLARTCFENDRMEKIIDLTIKKHINQKALGMFSYIAYKCLHETRFKRPMIAKVVSTLKNTLKVQGGSHISPADAALVIQMRFRSFIKRKDQIHTNATLLIQKKFRSFMIEKDHARMDDKVASKLKEANTVKGDSHLSPTAAALLIQINFWLFSLKKNRSSSDAVHLIQLSFVSHMTRTSRKYNTITDAILLIQPTFRLLKNRRAENLLALDNFYDPITAELHALFYNGTYHNPPTDYDDSHESMTQAGFAFIFSIVLLFFGCYHIMLSFFGETRVEFVHPQIC